MKALLMFAMFGILAANTAFDPFADWEVQSGPLLILQGIVDAALVSWLGKTGAALALALLAVGVPFMMLSKDGRGSSQPTGPIHARRPGGVRTTAAGRGGFGKR